MCEELQKCLLGHSTGTQKERIFSLCEKQEKGCFFYMDTDSF